MYVSAIHAKEIRHTKPSRQANAYSIRNRTMASRDDGPDDRAITTVKQRVQLDNSVS